MGNGVIIYYSSSISCSNVALLSVDAPTTMVVLFSTSFEQWAECTTLWVASVTVSNESWLLTIACKNARKWKQSLNWVKKSTHARRFVLPRLTSWAPSSINSWVMSSSPMNCWNPTRCSTLCPTLNHVRMHSSTMAMGKYMLKPSEMNDITSMWPMNCA